MKQLIHRVFQKKWLCASLITAFSIVLFLLLFVEHYETGDDFWINSIASGFTSDRDYHIVFNNVILGHLLVFLNTVAPQIPWYGLLQYATAFLALSSVVYLLLKNHPPYYILAIGLILSFFCYELFIRAEFTKISGVAAASGILLLLYALDRDDLPKKELILGMILLFIGSLYRIAGFIGALSIWIVYGIIRLASLFHTKQRTIVRHYLLVLPCMLVLCIGIWGIDFASYRFDPEWNDYKKFLTTEKTLNDFSYPEYTENIEAYQAADVNENARTMYSHMDIADPDKYTIPVIEKIAEGKPSLPFTPQTFWSFLKSSLTYWFRDYPYVYAVLVLFFLALASQKHRLQNIATLVGTVALFLMLEYILYLRGRYALNRVDLILFYAMATVAIMLMLQKQEIHAPSVSLSLRKELISSVIALTICLVFGTMLYHIQPPHTHGIDIEASDTIEKASQKNFYSLLNDDQKNTYLISWAVSDCSICYGPLDPIGYRSGSNQIYLGGWLIESPVYHAQLSERNIQNPFLAMIQNPNVFLLQNGVYIENTLSYLNDYYRIDGSDSPYYGVLVKNIQGNLVYRITNDALTKQFLSFDLSEIRDGKDVLTSYTEIHPTSDTADTFDTFDVSGSLYLDGENSFQQQIFLLLEDKTTGKTFPFYMTQEENPFAGDLFHGQFSAFSGTARYQGKLMNYNIWLIYKNGSNLFKLKVDEYRVVP